MALGLFILPVQNGKYALLAGEGYLDIPPITTEPKVYSSKLPFEPVSSTIGDSEMQHLDLAYAASIIRTFTGDESLVLTIRGRKYTPEFSFAVGRHTLKVKSVQTEVDAGYEGKSQIVLVEAKSGLTSNTIIRQLFYPYRQWRIKTKKPVSVAFFSRHEARSYNLWLFTFENDSDYNSIKLTESSRYVLE